MPEFQRFALKWTFLEIVLKS